MISLKIGRTIILQLVALFGCLFPIYALCGSGNFEYRYFITAPKSRALYEERLGKSCVEGLVAFYSNPANSLKSPHVMEIAVRFSSLDKSNRLYHYTNSNTVINAFAPNETNRSTVHARLASSLDQFAYDDILKYGRSGANKESVRFSPSAPTINNTVMYVANDPYSSSEFGRAMISLDLAPTAMVIRSTHDISIEKIRTDFKASIYSPITKSCNLNDILWIIIADSGVDLIDYSTDIYSPAPGWYHLLSFKNIIGNDILLFSSANPEIGEINIKLKSVGRESEVSKYPGDTKRFF